jgi:RNA polymerase sigma-70 factor (ECF subfamily)
MEASLAVDPGKATDDLDALLAAREGEHEAGRILMSRHGPSMVRTAWRVLGRYGGTEAEDVVQEAFIAALTTDALPHGDVGAWLRSIAARKALDTMRRTGRRQEQALPEEEEGEAELAAGQSPEQARLEVWTVRRGLALLSPSDRAVLTLVDLEGFSMAEAARMLGLTRVAIKLRAVRARRKLAKALTERSGTERD